MIGRGAMEPAPLAVSMIAAGTAAFLARWAAALYAPRNGRPPGFVPLAVVALAAFTPATAILPSAALFALSLGLGTMLLALAAIDLAAFRLPDVLTLPLLAAGLCAAVWLPDRPVLDHLLGAVVGWAALAGLAWAFARTTGRDGVGLGDAKLLGAGGAWLGWEALPSVVLIACAAAFVWIALRALLRAGGPRERLAFGAPLAAAIWVVWLVGPLAF